MSQTQTLDSAAVERLVGQVADEFTARLDRGERPDVEEYARDHPVVADVLRQVLPALRLIRLSAAAPLVDSHADTSPVSGCLGDFRIVREVGRGGMGVVYEAVQLSLERRVALKVLPFAGALDARQLQRFKNEAQAAAHLQHQGIVPVYYVGCERGVHFYAMQFIDGRTLAELIHELRQLTGLEPIEAGEEPRQPAAGAAAVTPSLEATGAYEGAGARAGALETTTAPLPGLPTERAAGGRAHFHMVARLGIQAAEALEHAHQLGVVHRDVKPANLLVETCSPLAPRGRGVGGEGLRLWVTDFGLAHCQSQAGLTMTGDLVGTLRYMSPEQALAQRVTIDHRTDIYSLGATLYELLTLEPAFPGRDRQELLRQIAFEEPRPPRRVNKAVPPELETIVVKAMEKNPADRYATAQELADDLERFLKDEPIRARRPTLVQRARKWARRHRAAVWAAAASGSVTLIVLALSVGWAVRDRDARRAAMADQVNLALNEAAVLQGQQQWRQARAAVKRAEALLADAGGDATLHNRARQLAKDLPMAARLDDLRLEKSHGADASFSGGDPGTADAYARAFQDYGIDVLTEPVDQVATSIQARSIAEQLVAGLDDWILVQTDRRVRERLRAVASSADANPWRNRMRQAVVQNDRRALEELAARPEVADFPPATGHLLGQALANAGAGPLAVRVLAAVQQRHPQDFWLNYQLGIQFLWGARVRHDASVAAGYLRAALVARTDYPTLYTYLGLALPGPEHLDEVIALNRKAIELAPPYVTAHMNLGNALHRKGRLDEAVAEFRVAGAIAQGDPGPRVNLGNALRDKGRLDEAIAAFRDALRINNDLPQAHLGLGLALTDKGWMDEAIAEFREALRIHKADADAHTGLGNALRNKGQLDDAIAAFKAAIRLKKDYREAHGGLGNALYDKGRLDEAIVEFREAIRLRKDYADAHNNLGAVLREKGRVDEAIAELREAIRLKHDHAGAHNNLAGALRAKGRADEAVAELREAIRLGPGEPMFHYNLGHALGQMGRLDEAIAEYRQALRLKQAYPEAHNNLGDALCRKGLRDEAMAEFRRAIRLRRDYAMPHYNLGTALAAKGLLDEAIRECREAIRLKEGFAEAHCNLGDALCRKGLLDEAIAEHRKALALKADYADAHCGLGLTLMNKGRFAEALPALRRGHELGSRQPDWHHPSAQWIKQCETLLAQSLRKTDPKDAEKGKNKSSD